MKDFLTGGELAALFDLNIQTLHYYESIGLFVPVRRRDASGERVYRFDQIYRLATIRFLKRLGYPLARIKSDLESRDPAHSLARMREQSEELARQIQNLVRTRDAIERKIRFVGERTGAPDGVSPGGASPDLASFTRQHFAPRRYLPIGMEERLYRNDDFYFYPTIVFYEGSSRRFGALVPQGAPEPTAGEAGVPKLLDIPEGDYLVGSHIGPYERIRESFSRLRDAAGTLGLTLAAPDTVIAVNIIDQFVERDTARYVTELQMALQARDF